MLKNPKRVKKSVRTQKPVIDPGQGKGREGLGVLSPPISPMTTWLTPSQKANMSRNILYSGLWQRFWRKLPRESLQKISTPHSYDLVWDTKCLYMGKFSHMKVNHSTGFPSCTGASASFWCSGTEIAAASWKRMKERTTNQYFSK